MVDDLTGRAEARLEASLTASGARDPREFYRERLRELKRIDEAGYADAVQYYRGVLIPDVAEERTEPLEAWTEYGRRLAEKLAPGRTVGIDGTGRARPYDPTERSALILHVPSGKGRALLVSLPESLTDAQRATYDVLVAGKQRSSG